MNILKLTEAHRNT